VIQERTAHKMLGYLEMTPYCCIWDYPWVSHCYVVWSIITWVMWWRNLLEDHFSSQQKLTPQWAD